MDRAEKEAFVKQMKETVSGANVIVIAHYSGLNVVEMNELRNRMRKRGAQFRVTKNRLTKLALEGTQYAGIADMFVGPTAIAFPMTWWHRPRWRWSSPRPMKTWSLLAAPWVKTCSTKPL